MPAFLLEEVAYSPSHILSTPLYIPQNILENMRIFPSIISLIHPRGAKNERLKAKKWRTGAILLKLFARTPTRSCPRCQHSYSRSTSGTKSPKRRDNAWNMQDETAGISTYSGLERWDSSPGPSIFRGIFRNTKFWRTLYIPKEIPEYLAKAKFERVRADSELGQVRSGSCGTWTEPARN